MKGDWFHRGKIIKLVSILKIIENRFYAIGKRR